MERREFTPVSFSEELKMLQEKNGVHFSDMIHAVESLDRPLSIATMRDIKAVLGEVMRVLNVSRYPRLRSEFPDSNEVRDLGVLWTVLYPQVQNLSGRLRELAANNRTELAEELVLIQDKLQKFFVLSESIFTTTP